MKILLIANINSTHTKKWALALKEKGISVFLFSLNKTNNKDYWYQYLDGVYYPENDSFNLVKKYFLLYKALKDKIGLFNPDIIHSHYITNYSLLGNLVGFKNHIITAWGSDVYFFPKKNFLNRWMIRYNLRKAKAIISTSHAMALELSLYTKKPITVIPFGIDFNQFKPRTPSAIRNKKVNIACFKKIESVYAPDVLIHSFYLALKKLPDYDLTLTLVGDGKMMEEIKQLVSDLNITNKVIFSGWVNPDNIPGLLSDTDLCVYLSRNESFGVSLIESMAVKVPLIVTKTPGFLEVAVNESNALFVDFDNPEQTADKIVQLILDSVLYKSLCENAYLHAIKKYNLSYNIEAQVDLYNNVLKK